ATTKDINSAYLNLIKLYHPDRIKTPEEFDQNKFQRIVEAHSILKNEQFRKFYDSFGYDACKKLLSNKLVQTGPAAETRTKETVEDLLKSYAKIKADEDSQMLFNLVNPRGKFKFHADCRELFYADQFTGYPINNNCNSLEQTIDFDIGDKNLLSLGGKITDNLGCAKSSIFGSFIHQIRPGFTFESSFDSLRTNANLGLVRDFQRFGILSSNINLFLKEYQTILPTLTLGYSRHLDKLSTSRANISTSVSPGLSYVSAGLLHSDVYKNIHTSSSINLKFGNIIQLSAKSVLKSESSSLKITNVAEYGYLTKKLCIGIEKGFNQCTKILSRVSLNLLSGIRLTVGIKRGKYIYALPMQLSDEIILQPVAVALISLFLASDGIRCFGDYISKCLNRTITDPEDIAKQTNASYDRLKKCDEYVS
ncbi:MAG: DnaJ (Hsp40), subfamily C, member 11, partial [Marteilia pararefringens]